MRPLVTPEQMSAADRAAVDAGTPAEVLMERAGRAIAREVVVLLQGRYGRRAVVVAGRGNNGGDGFVAARVLETEGIRASCVLPVGTAPTGPAATHFSRMRAAGVSVAPLSEGVLKHADAIVDALFGTGFRGPAEGAAAEAIDAVNASPAPCVSADIPSGVNGGTGNAPGAAIRADVTVAMAAQKMGSAVGEGAERSGSVVVADIGVAVEDPSAWLAEASDVAGFLRPRPAASHKGSSGAVALLAGSDALPGAAHLAARGAARTGAGYVMLATTGRAKAAADALLPEVLVSEASDGGVLGPDAGARFAPALERAACVAAGPGIGADVPQGQLVEQLLEDLRVPLVLDADALNVLAGRTGTLARRSGETVITPHPGELASLLETSADELQRDRVGSARRAARLFRCVVLLKGHRSVVAAPDGRVVVVPAGGPELATAGTGDVLTGVVAALIAAGTDPFDAAWCGAYLHGEAGAIAAGLRADVGVVAWDVAEALPQARRGFAGNQLLRRAGSVMS